MRMITIYEQTHFDIAVQELGDLDAIASVLGSNPNPNDSIPFGTTIDLPSTDDITAKNRIFNNVKLSTGIHGAGVAEAGIGEWYITSPSPVFTVQ